MQCPMHMVVDAYRKCSGNRLEPSAEEAADLACAIVKAQEGVCERIDVVKMLRLREHFQSRGQHLLAGMAAQLAELGARP